jgi:DnaK suppressor protein
MLVAIDASLKRIDEGTYGTCANCGQEIVEPRLEAYPWASLCIDCKREAERG